MTLKKLKRILLAGSVLLLVLLLTIVCINASVVGTASPRILESDQLSELDADYILVLGCGLRSDGSPSDMLHDRVSVGAETFLTGVSDKLLLSGDRAGTSYDEVTAMKRLALELGVSSDEIDSDYEGFSTYESVQRAKEVFGAEKIIIVTQKYHLCRALYIADSLGLDAYGVPADLRSYRGQTYRDIRELAARVKDFFLVIGNNK